MYLRAEPDNEERLIAMQPAGIANGLARFEAELPWDRANDATHYAFKVLHGRRQTCRAALVRGSAAALRARRTRGN